MLKTILKLIGMFLDKSNNPQPRSNPQQSSPAPRPAQQHDEVIKQINDDGYVWQPRLWRRYVMAQMFSMLGRRRNLPLSEANYDLCLKRRQNGYAWRVLRNEMLAQALLWNDDREQFAERNRWFNKQVIEQIARDFDNRSLLNAVAAASTPDELNRVMRASGTPEGPKSPTWVNAYKGAGAYFTMKNLILFHNCKVHLDNGQVLDTDASFNYLKEVNAQPSTTGNSLFAMMMKLISDNNFTWRG